MRQDLCTCPKDALDHRNGCPVVPFRFPNDPALRQREALRRLKLAGELEKTVQTASEFEDALETIKAILR